MCTSRFECSNMMCTAHRSTTASNPSLSPLHPRHFSIPPATSSDQTQISGNAGYDQDYRTTNNNHMAWDCACMFNNPEAAAVCFWCKAQRPGYEDSRQPQGQTSSQLSSIQQEAATIETPAVTAATGSTSAVEETGTQEGQIRCFAWVCKCSFMNPGTAMLCFWCEAPQPGYADDAKPLGDNKEPSTGTQEGVVASSVAVTAGGFTGTSCERVQGTSTNDMSIGLETLTESEEDTTNENATAKA